MGGEEERFGAAAAEAVPAGGSEVWVYDHLRRRFHAVPDSLAQLLPLLSGFRTLKEHRSGIVQAGWQDDGSGYLDTLLRELIRHGLLRSRTEFLKNVQAVDDQGQAPPPITTVGWVTRDRRETLRESLQSFVSAMAGCGRAAALKVFDDSAQASQREATRVLLLELGKRLGVEVRYAGEEEKRAFAAKLARELAPEGIAPELIEFALFDPFGLGHSFGANGNAFLLATQGELALKLDDDTFCRFASPAEPRPGLALSSRPDPTRIRLFPDRASLEAAFPLRELDPLGAHEGLLGRSAADCLAGQEGRRIHCEEVGPELLQLLESYPARVAATMTGICGDSGMGSCRYFLSLTGADREALVGSEERYRAALASRQLLRAAPCPTLSSGELFMGMNCGYDNRELLPPFFPVLRNSDGLFAQVLRRCLPGALIGHLPLAGDHRPPQARRFAEGEARSVGVRLMDLLILLVRDYPPVPGAGQSPGALGSLGSYLIEAASLKPKEFEDCLRRLWVRDMARYLEHLERLLDRYRGEPDYWAEDVEAQRESVRWRVEAGPDITPEDVAARKGAEGALPLAQVLVRRYGELLAAWPAIAAGARRLKAAGVAL